MGYIIALESFATTQLPRFYQKVKETYDGKACRFIKLHAEEDPEHIEKAIQLTSTLSEDLQDIVLANVVQTARSYVVMVEACITPLSSDLHYSTSNLL
jgi:pyrroloquinoline quinone (PQQ) biosynthesis protein C